MNESKFLKKRHNNEDSNKRFKKYLLSFFSKILISAIIFLVVLIVTKRDDSLKSKINEKVFKTNFSFATVNKWYKDTFGEILPFDNLVSEKDVSVFNEKITYKANSLYKDGVKLTVTDKYLVPILQSGIVVFMGEKENYGQTIIIQQVDGIDVWYSNIDASNINLYDYVEKGTLLGEAKGDYIYLVFQKDGKFLDYKEYI